MYFIQEKPRIGIPVEDAHEVRTVKITEIAVGTGRIAVDMDRSGMPQSRTRVALLASLSLSGEQIEGLLGKDDGGADNALAYVYNKYGMHSRTGIARCFFDLGVYTVTKACAPLNLTPREHSMVTYLSYGQTNREIASQFDKHYKTITNWLNAITKETGWQGREQIALASMVSGEVGPFVADGMEKMRAAMHTPPTTEV